MGMGVIALAVPIILLAVRLCEVKSNATCCSTAYGLERRRFGLRQGMHAFVLGGGHEQQNDVNVTKSQCGNEELDGRVCSQRE